MDYFRKTFNVEWLIETVDEKALRQYASEVAEAVEQSIDGSRPLFLTFQNSVPPVQIAHCVVSGCDVYGCTDFAAEPLKEKDNWVNFGLTDDKYGIKPFGKVEGRISMPFRAGNDQRGVERKDDHAEYHLDTPLLHHAPLSGIPRDKELLPTIAKKLSENLLGQYVKEINSGP